MINMDGSYTYIDELCQSNIEYLPNFVIYVLVICSLEIALLDRCKMYSESSLRLKIRIWACMIYAAQKP
jgi:hypothetical protein